ncbi:MAG: hypothetical protein LC685_04150 [Actinobacteria bacterium]|nr:hypothetical protein [Actinomycetota bacterium]
MEIQKMIDDAKTFLRNAGFGEITSQGDAARAVVAGRTSEATAIFQLSLGNDAKAPVHVQQGAREPRPADVKSVPAFAGMASLAADPTGAKMLAELSKQVAAVKPSQK